VGGADFYLNGAINHYPDFIVKTRNGRIVLVETKGDNTDPTQNAHGQWYWRSLAFSR